MFRKIALTIVLVAVFAFLGAFFVRAEAAPKKRIPSPKAENAQLIYATFCLSFGQIRHVAKLVLVGNSPEEVLMHMNSDWQFKICERGWAAVRKPALMRKYETDTSAIAIFRVETSIGRRYIYFTRSRLKV